MATSWTEEQLIEAVKTSKGITETVSKLYVGFAGSHFQTVWKHIRRLDLDTSHFQRGKFFDVKGILVKGKKVSSGRLRKALKKVREYRCEKCGNDGIHVGEPLTLQVEHVDGDNTNNEEINLKWLCPNCHSQTPTYARPKTKPRRRFIRPTISIDCSRCSDRFELDRYQFETKRKKGQKNFYCGPQCSSPPRVDRDLVIQEYERIGSYRAVAKKFEVSDVTIKKIVTKHRERTKGVHS